MAFNPIKLTKKWLAWMRDVVTTADTTLAKNSAMLVSMTSALTPPSMASKAPQISSSKLSNNEVSYLSLLPKLSKIIMELEV
jgi:hypothetical protein